MNDDDPKSPNRFVRFLERLWGRLYKTRNEYVNAAPEDKLHFGATRIEHMEAQLEAHLEEYTKAAKRATEILVENDELRAEMALLKSAAGGSMKGWVKETAFDELRAKLKAAKEDADRWFSHFNNVTHEWTTWFMNGNHTIEALPPDIRKAIYEHYLAEAKAKLGIVDEPAPKPKRKTPVKKAVRRGAKATKGR